MTIEQILQKMIGYEGHTTHDVAHLLKVWGYAHTIGLLEHLDERTLHTLEIAAIVHDIACPLCRIRYGNTNGKYQELESPALVRAFLSDCDLDASELERIVYLVSHHHTITDVQGLDYQILLEADFLVNADESSLSLENIRKMNEVLFKTKTGKALLKSIYKF